MKLRVVENNMEWMKRLFVNGMPINTSPPSNKLEKNYNEDEAYTVKSQRLVKILKHKRDEKVVVTGDINDGMGSDFYEGRFGRSAIELLMGSIYQPELILKSALGKLKIGKHGFTPSSSTFTDTITGNWFTVLIDHILVSQDIKIYQGVVMNPYHRPSKDNLSDDLKSILKKASDHFPVYADIEI